MKKTLLTLALVAICGGAFAQGKISFVNDSLHRVYWDPAGLKSADQALAGTGAMAAATPSGATLIADLYWGTASDNLAFLASTTLSPSIPGHIPTQTLAIAGQPGGTMEYFQVQIRQSGYANAAAARAAVAYYGFSQVFTAVLGSFTPNSIVTHTAPSLSTWTDGTFLMDSTSPGWRGAIAVGVIPEPSTFALAGLGAAAMLIFRRRK